MSYFIFDKSFSARISLLLFLIVGTFACKSTEPKTTAQNEDTEKSELEELYWERIEDKRDSFTEADVKFMTGMIAHHAQALIMSRMAPENGASPRIQTLCSRIINAQKDEIQTMQQWLRDRDQPVPQIEFDGLRLDITLDGEQYTSFRKMRGVLSQKKMKEIANARGSEFDRLFLTHMIEHHKGAVYMVENLFNTDGAAQDRWAFKIASDIQVDQRTEIARMQRMLDEMTD